MKRTSRNVMSYFVICGVSFVLALGTGEAFGAGAGSTKSKVQSDQLKRAAIADELKQQRQAAEKQKRQDAEKERKREADDQKAMKEAEVASLSLPEDTTARLAARELVIAGNTIISTEQLLNEMPLVYNASSEPLELAASASLYDLRTVGKLIESPGQVQEVSMRTIQGLTQYILSVYQKDNHAGIYVYVPEETVADMKLRDETLLVQVLEAKVSEVTVNAYNTEQEAVDEPILRRDLIEKWSPLEIGEVANSKKLEDYLNLLNLNPDRYVSASVSQGDSPQTLKVGYDIYEANPWHFYTQLDNSGSKERQWSPRVGVINTNLTGRDDRFSATYQAPIDSINENYAVFGNYDFPLYTPRLRLNLYGGYSQFDVSSSISNLDFIGNGSFYGGVLRFNAFQENAWFFDLTASLSHESSKSSAADVGVFDSDVSMDLWGAGVDIHHKDDMSSTSISFNRLSSFDGSKDSAFEASRPAADNSFTIYSLSAAHSQFLDPDKIQFFTGSLRWVQPNDRLVSAKETTFGGLYSVRGYDEYEVIADGGLLYSLQYEYDLIKHCQVADGLDGETEVGGCRLTRLAPLGFFDFGRAKIKHPEVGDKEVEELASVGVGLSATVANNFDANVYYGIPLRTTSDTDAGQGRWNLSFMMRW